ncbi:MAG: tRNA pseudouridine(13) synthase TruD [Halomonas sp.]|nr:tRNA pseudouridine(13) synthase TruD [Halomonas sp.]MDN6296667.1 tRNA pseudouridine(13) synthase TruD [Halomonas sp.]MDN6314144.1 tRNA pseudouridine(13) synthase TruD [Halomonas sp.]MDN6335173.1 tRNA pseudouridine(13) synthase TruD [Halomonas sp.]
MSLTLDWARCLDTTFGPPNPGDYRAVPEDFLVDEVLDFAPEGHGEHLWLRIEKRRQTTLDVVNMLARLCAVTPRDIGYSGMKDRVAVTRQWLSVHLPGRDAPEQLEERLAALGTTVLERARHPRKLKRGVHRANRFSLRISGEAVKADDFAVRWQTLCASGVPNYFGPQRFGAGGRNLARVQALFARGWRKRDDRQGMLLSSARSFLFNELLNARLQAGCWATPLDGDTLMLEGTQSIFSAEHADDKLRRRAAELDVHPAGLLWGTGAPVDVESGAPAQRFEAQLQDQHPALCAGIEQAGASCSRRALRLRLGDPAFVALGEGVRLTFSLPKGSFATAVLRELIEHPDFAPLAAG